jgi:hypothetical protein
VIHLYRININVPVLHFIEQVLQRSQRPVLDCYIGWIQRSTNCFHQPASFVVNLKYSSYNKMFSVILHTLITSFFDRIITSAVTNNIITHQMWS